MSGGYADRLKHYPHKGVCGLPEQLDTERQLKVKLQEIAERVRDAKHLVVFTGAGISTSAGIPDFRGPSGIWTKQQAKEKAAAREKKKAAKKRAREDGGADDAAGASSTAEQADSSTQVDFASAKPTYTHRALVELERLGHLKFLVTQNVDGLDQRAGFPRSRMAVLHGCIFEEKCEKCGAIHLRDTAVDSISFKPTGNKCCAPCATSTTSRGGGSSTEDAPANDDDDDAGESKTEIKREVRSTAAAAKVEVKEEDAKKEEEEEEEEGGVLLANEAPVCGGVLRDTLLDWEDPLPEDELAQSEAHCEQADVVLALGTSLRIEPAGSLPTLAKSFVLVNLQQTPKDDEAALIVRAPVDLVMRTIMRDGFGLDF